MHPGDADVRLDGRVAIVTGAGAGLGRAHALGLAAAGACVIVNDRPGGAQPVVEEIRAAGGHATACPGDVSEWSTGEALVTAATTTYGRLDILVNNAGLTRDRMIFNMSEQEWDQVLAVHLKGHFVTSRQATAYWRERSKSEGGPVYARIVNTASEAFLFGSGGQPNYAAAKGGIAALTLSTAQSCARYGVRANAICPRARTDMTAQAFGPAPEQGTDPLAADHVSPLVTYLASPAAEHVTGQVFVAYGGMVVRMAAPAVGARYDATEGAWTAEGLARTLGADLAAEPGDGFVSTDLLALG